MATIANPSTGVLDMPGASKALEETMSSLMAMASGEVRLFNAPPVEVVNNAMRIARSLAEDVVKFQTTFTTAGFDVKMYNDVEKRALAFWQADVNFRQKLDPENRLAQLVPEATMMKKTLLPAAEYLWGNEPELGPKVAAIRSGSGHLDLADDLMSLATLFMDHWTDVDGKSRVTKNQLGRARELGMEIVKTVAPKDEARPVSDARDLRNRAGTYLRQACEEIRAAAAFMYRKTPDAMDRYPAPYSPKRRGKKTQPVTTGEAAGISTGDEM